MMIIMKMKKWGHNEELLLDYWDVIHAVDDDDNDDGDDNDGDNVIIYTCNVKHLYCMTFINRHNNHATFRQLKY